MTSDAFKRSLKIHQGKGFFKNLTIHRGIERESLRVTHKGQISQNNHPENLGSPLTSKDITTDFAEALVELVTPTFDSAEELFKHLSLLHKFLYSELGEEILWNFSMPCSFQNEREIRIAEYGDTNTGMLKHIYRKGLRLRYGSIMQCVSGIRYNFSLSKDSWGSLSNNPTQDFINNKYLGTIRNIKRNFWFILERLGASPIAHESYLLNREHSLNKHGKNDLFLPNATSLRMSEVGYQSSVQNALKISYNNLDNFIDAGIEYLELRGIDVNPFIPEGINENKIKLLDIYIIHSLISESPEFSDKEIEEIRTNQKVMVENGRSKDLKLRLNGIQIPLAKLQNIFCDELTQVADAMDEYRPGYANALRAEMNIDTLPSERIMNEIESQNLSFQEYALIQSKKIAQEHRSSLNNDFSGLAQNANNSLKDLKNLKENMGMDINKYVELYNSKI